MISNIQVSVIGNAVEVADDIRYLIVLSWMT